MLLEWQLVPAWYRAVKKGEAEEEAHSTLGQKERRD